MNRIRTEVNEGAYKLVFVKFKNRLVLEGEPTKAIIQVFNTTREDNGYSFNDYENINKDSSKFIDAFSLDKDKLDTLAVFYFGDTYFSTEGERPDELLLGEVTDGDFKIIMDYLTTKISKQMVRNISWDSYSTDIEDVEMFQTQELKFWEDFEGVENE